MQEIEYAKALFELASDNNLILDQFEKFIEILKMDNFYELLKAPNIKKANKKEILNNVLVGFDKTFIHFIYVIIDNNRTNDISDIFDSYYKLVVKSENKELVDLYVSKEIEKNNLEKIKQKLELKFNKGIIIRMHIEPKLIGGMRIEYDGKCIDESLINEFSKIKSLL